MAKPKSAAEEKRLERKIAKHRENESRWLQKVIFDLSKARHSRSQLASATGEELNPLITLDDGTQVSLDKLSDIIEQRVSDLMDALGQSSYSRRRG